MKYLLIDLYTGESSSITGEYLEEMKEGCELIEGACKVWKCEEHVIVEVK